MAAERTENDLIEDEERPILVADGLHGLEIPLWWGHTASSRADDRLGEDCTISIFVGMPFSSQISRTYTQ